MYELKLSKGFPYIVTLEQLYYSAISDLTDATVPSTGWETGFAGEDPPPTVSRLMRGPDTELTLLHKHRFMNTRVNVLLTTPVPAWTTTTPLHVMSVRALREHNTMRGANFAQIVHQRNLAPVMDHAVLSLEHVCALLHFLVLGVLRALVTANGVLRSAHATAWRTTKGHSAKNVRSSMQPRAINYSIASV